MKFDFGWKYEDFQKEPYKIDGTISHAIERLYCIVAQDEGYFSATVMSDDYARTELTNLDYMAREFSARIHKNLRAYIFAEKLDALEKCAGKRLMYPFRSFIKREYI